MSIIPHVSWIVIIVTVTVLAIEERIRIPTYGVIAAIKSNPNTRVLILELVITTIDYEVNPGILDSKLIIVAIDIDGYIARSNNEAIIIA